MLVKLDACSSTDCCPHPPARLASLLWTVLTLDNYKYLGVWLDCELSFQTHIKNLQSKIKSRIGFLFRNKASFTHAAKHTLVKLTILLTLDFSNVIYKIASNTLLSKLDAQCHPFYHQSPIYYPSLRPVCSRWLALATFSLPNPLAPGHLQVSAR
jgi:hypothetical protein